MTEQAKTPSGANALRRAPGSASAALLVIFALAACTASAVLPGAQRVLWGEFVLAFAVGLAGVLRGHRVATQSVFARRCRVQVCDFDAASMWIGCAARAFNGVAQMVKLRHVDAVDAFPGVLVSADQSLFFVIPESSVPVVVQARGVKQASVGRPLCLAGPANLVWNG